MISRNIFCRNPLRGVRTFLLLIGLVVVAVGCDKEVIPIPPPDLSTLELIKSTRYRQSAVTPDSIALDSLVKYIEKYSDLNLKLQSPNKHTLFAPSNKAFKELLSHPIFSSISGGLEAVNQDVLKSILAYHLVASVQLKKDLLPGLELVSLSLDPLSPSVMQKIMINPDSTLRGGVLSKAVRKVQTDNLSTNGVVHVIESVLVPPSVDPLSKNVGTLAFNIMVLKDFSIMAKLIQLADNGFKENEPERVFKIQTLLELPEKDALLTGLTTIFKNRLPSPQPNWVSGITFLAVPNSIIAAIKSLNSFISTASPESARQFLLNHILFGKYETANMKNNLLLYTMRSGFRSVLTNPSTLQVILGKSDPPLNPHGITLQTSDKRDAYIQYKDLSASNGMLNIIYGDLTPK